MLCNCAEGLHFSVFHSTIMDQILKSITAIDHTPRNLVFCTYLTIYLTYMYLSLSLSD